MNNEYILIPPSSDTSAPFYITLAGITYEDPSYFIKRRNDNVFVVEYVISGAGEIEVNGKRKRASAGDMYVIPAYSDHFYRSDPVDPWKKIWFNAGGALCNSLYNMYIPGKEFVFKNADGYRYMEKMLSLCAKKDISPKELNAGAAVIFSEIVIRVLSEIIKKDFSLSDAYALKDHIDRNFKKNITLEELSKAIFKSRSQTIRIFKNEYGQTPHEYLLLKKTESAKNLLKNTSLPIKTIALDLGFSDEHYFSSIFKQKTGVSPKEFRQTP